MKSRQLFMVMAAEILLGTIFQSTSASSKTWYLKMTGGGFTGFPIEMKSQAACEKTRRGLLSLDRHRHSVSVDGSIAKGRCTAGPISSQK